MSIIKEIFEEGTGRAAQFVNNNTTARLVRKAAFSPDKAGKTLGNLYTGYKPNSKTIMGASALAVGGTIAENGGLGPQKISLGNEFSMDSFFNNKGIVAKNTAPPVVSMNPSIMASGTISPKSSAPTLNATGDMVFGMHNGRHG